MSRKYYDEHGNEVTNVKEVKPLYKRWWIWALLVILLIAFFSSTEETATVDTDEPQGEPTEQTTDESADADVSQDTAEPDVEEEPLVTVDQLSYDISLQEPDTIGNVYATVTFTNNSDYPLTSFSLRAVLRDSNENTYYGTHDTVMPGEMSANFEGRGPESGNLEDIEIQRIEYRVHLDDGTEQMVSYDTKLDTYDVVHIKE